MEVAGAIGCCIEEESSGEMVVFDLEGVYSVVQLELCKKWGLADCSSVFDQSRGAEQILGS